MGKIEFKEFVKKNPSLVKYVKNNEMTWQKFYEIYDMYGEDNEVWKDYLTVETTTVTTADFLSWLKNINLDEIQEGLNSVSRVISVFQDFGNKKEEPKSEYKPRPIYKNFED